MNYAQLGQKVKAKYPDYQSLSDEEVGKRVAAKYPEYQSQITQKTGTQQGADVLRSIGLGVLPDIGANAFDIGKSLLTGNRTDPNNPQGYDNPLRTPDQLTKQFGGEGKLEQLLSGYKQSGKDTAGLLSWAIPMGASLKAAAGLGAGAGALNAASQEEVNPLKVAAGAATGAVAGPVLKGVGSLVGNATGKAGQAVKEQGEQLVLRGLKANRGQLNRFKEKTGMDLADFLNEEGITGDFAKRAAGKLDELQDAFDDIAVKSGVKVPGAGLITKMSSYLDDIGLGGSTDPSDAARVEKVNEIVANIIKKHGDAIDVKHLTAERRFYDKKVKDFAASPEVASVYKLVRDGLQDAIQEGTEQAGKPGLKEIGLSMRNFFQFKKIAEQQADLGRGTNLLGLLNTLGAGVGGTVGGIPGAIAGYGVMTAARNPKVIRTASGALKGTGAMVEGLSKNPAVAGRFAALQRALRNTAASQMSRKQLPNPQADR